MQAHWIKFLVVIFSLAWLPLAQAAEVMVYKSMNCGCCADWVNHMRSNGFTVIAKDVEDVSPYKTRYGVPAELQSCHTAVVDGYVIEGHVPAKDIKRLLEEKPKITGLAVPGMPIGSPGMEGPVQQPYEVKAFDKAGNRSVYAHY